MTLLAATYYLAWTDGENRALAGLEDRKAGDVVQ